MPFSQRAHAAPLFRALLFAGLAVLALLLCAPAGARAAGAPFDFAGPQAQRAFQLADTQWGGRPCGGQIAMRWVDESDPEINAMSHWTPGSPSNTGCSIDFNLGADWSEAKFCTIVVHELGHLSGHPHSSDPNDLMSAYYTDPWAPCAPASATPPSQPRASTAPKDTGFVARVSLRTRILDHCGRAPKAHRSLVRYRRCAAYVRKHLTH